LVEVVGEDEKIRGQVNDKYDGRFYVELPVAEFAKMAFIKIGVHPAV